MRLIKDSRGKKSWSWTLAIPALFLFTLRAALSGIDVTVAGLHFTLASVDGLSYAAMCGPWLAYLGQREYVEKVKNGNGEAKV